MKRSKFTRKFNFVVSLCVCLAMLFSLAPAVELEAYGASDSLTSTIGVYWVAGHEITTDETDTYIYDDALLTGDSLEYNRSLATMTYELAIASMSSDREPKTAAGYANKSRNLRAYLEDNGFVDFDTNPDYTKRMTTETMGVACAHKKIIDNGKEYTLLVIAPRSAGYEAEWGGNFMMNEDADDTGDSYGFRHGKDIVLNYVKEYVSKYGIKGDVKVWLEGYSRGAGVTNQVGAALINRPNDILGSGVNLTPGNLYCYTYGTPNSASTTNGTEGSFDDSKFNYIHNTLEPYDLVTIMPPDGLGFGRYGTVTNYAKAENKDRMLSLLKDLNPTLHDIYTSVGDPDEFSPKTIDMEKLMEGTIELKNDPHSYLPDSQEKFLETMSGAITAAVGSREAYYSGNYQDALKDLVGYYYSHLDKGGDLISGIKGCKFTPYMIGSMYVSYMVERYKDKVFDEATITQIQELIDQIKALEEAGVEVPQELKEQLAALEQKLVVGQRWETISEITRTITAILYSKVMEAGLTEAGLKDEDPTLYNKIIGSEEATAMSRILPYVLLYDPKQTEDVISFEEVSQQMKHFATLVGNASKFQRPHTDEVMLSWFRTLDSNYDDFTKENAAQIAGYRRLYIDQPDGVSVTATVKDGSGNTVAVVKDGVLTSRTDKWIGVTTCDTGNWIRLPADQTYRVELKTNKNTKLNLKATEYNVDEGKVVREVTSDKSYNWKGLQVNTSDKVTWVISAIPSDYKIASNAYYYIEKVGAAQNVLVAKGTAKGKRSAKITWNKISEAERYVIYMSKCNTKKKKYTPKKVKTVSASKQTWTRKLLKKGKKYKFYVVAQKKVNGKYVEIARSRMGHVITNNRSGKYTNPKALKLSTSQMSLAVGKTGTITGSVSKMKAKKKLMYSHEAKLRFTSTNPTVAKVDANGKVTAVAQGSCTIYVQTINGIWKTVKVTVK